MSRLRGYTAEVRIAFIGGNGHHYLKGLLDDPARDLEVAAASDGHDAGAAATMAGRLAERLDESSDKSVSWYDSPAALMDEFRPDVVSVGAVYAHNGTIAALALERDIPVVSDKPIAASWEQLERLRALTEVKGRNVIAEFPFRCQREFRAAHEAVRAGHIGRVILATGQKSYRFGASRPAWYKNPEDYPGTLLWVASHAIDAIHYCTGLRFSRSLTTGGNLSRPDYAPMEDHVLALYELENGAHAMVHADYLRPAGAGTHGDDRLRIVGSTGQVEVRADRCILIDAEGESDITDSVQPRSVEEELLAGAHGESDVYSTADSLEVAAILLRTRDAVWG